MAVTTTPQADTKVSRHTFNRCGNTDQPLGLKHKSRLFVRRRRGLLDLMKTHVVIGALAAVVLAANASAEPFRIGVAAPLSGPYSLLGEQIGKGAEAAAS